MHQNRLPLAPARSQPVPPARPPLVAERRLRGELDELSALLPEFERRPFSSGAGRANPFLDVIVRRESAELALPEVPVGVVSTRYALVQHAEAALAVRGALAAIGVHPREMPAEVELAAYGARMALSVRLPRPYDFDPGDGHPLALRLVCLNSVDGSSKLRLLLGWYRFVCANGLAVGTTRAEWRLAHRDGLRLESVEALLREGLEVAARERIALTVWRGLAVPIERFVAFADHALAPAWGVKAAARFLHIATTGHDAELAQPFEPGPPHAKTMIRGRRVPGAPAHATSAYDAAQALAWIARERRDAREQIDRVLEIPELMQLLLARR